MYTVQLAILHLCLCTNWDGVEENIANELVYYAKNEQVYLCDDVIVMS